MIDIVQNVDTSLPSYIMVLFEHVITKSPIINSQTAANCAELRCQSDGVYGSSPCRKSWGEWMEESCSDQGAKICGIQTRTESDQGLTGDDSGLNNIKIFCCTGYP